ncbi:hypothetical protein Sjap_016109 [Stephania japonica]|uniref:PWWP domain-containing protein n=1 Tax=Stephania japonica TaxID=461633 RepID=A0AAP0IKN7_9MAGN
MGGGSWGRSEIVEGMEGEDGDGNVFSVGDFVWGKVKGRPWWPGRIYDPSEVSESVARYQRKDSVLVAFFGDDTFSWCSPPSQLKPFFESFEAMSGQGTSAVFVNAIQEAVEEFSRCVESEMTCSCVPLGSQSVGTKETKMGGGVIDKSFVTEFKPTRFLHLLRDVAEVISKVDKLEFAVFQSQLSAFRRAKGQNQLVVSPETEEMMGSGDGNEDETKNEVSFAERTTDLNQLAPEGDWAPSPLSPGFHNVSVQNCGRISDKLHPRKKQRSMSDLMTIPAKKGMKSNDSGGGTASGLAEDNTGPGNHALTGTVKHGKRKRPRPPAIVTDIPNDDVLNDDGSLESSKTGSLTRERKKSKYLSPPYTTIDRGFKSFFSFKDSETEHQNIRTASDTTEDEKLHKNSEKSRKPYSSLSPRTPKQPQKKIDLKLADIVVEEAFVAFQCVAIDLLYLKGKSCSETVMNFFIKFRSSMYESNDKLMSSRAVASHPSEENMSLDFKHGSQEKDKHKTDQPSSIGKSGTENWQRREDPTLMSTEGKDPDVIADHNGGLNGSQQTTKPDQPTLADLTTLKKRGRKKKSESADGNGIVKTDQPKVGDGSEPKKRGRKKKPESADGNGVVKADQPTVDNGSEPKKRGRKRKSECADGNSIMKTDGPTLGERSEPKKRGRKRKSVLSGGNGNGKSNGEASSAALILTFVPNISLPSKEYLIEAFRKFGALDEVKSEVTKDSSSASIVFTRSSDAEKALKSSMKASPVGPDVISYRLQYLSSSPRNSEHSEIPVQNIPSSAGGEAPPLDVIKNNLKMMTSTLEKSGDELTPEVKANLEAQIHSLLKKLSTVVGTPTPS